MREVTVMNPVSGRASDDPRVLLGVANLLQTEIDVDVLLRRIVDQLVAAMDADRGTLVLVDRARSELWSAAAHLPELPEIRLLLGQGIAGLVAATGEAVSIDDAQRDRRFFVEVDQSTGYTTRSVLAVPLIGRGDARRVVG